MRRCVLVAVSLFLLPSMLPADDASPLRRVEIGIRTSHFVLQDDARGSGNHYLGSLDEFRDDQEYGPLPFVNMIVCPYLVLGVGYEKGYRLGAGCNIALYRNWELVLSGEHTLVDINATYYLYGEVWGEAEFPLDHTRYGMGVKCAV